MSGHHRKVHPSLREARHERTLLQLVQGPGVVPVLGGSGPEVVTRSGKGSLADVLAERGTMSEALARGAGARVARAAGRLHADGIVHGDIKPSNVAFAPDGDLWLIDFDAGGATDGRRRRGTVPRLRDLVSLRVADDMVAIAILVVECATGVAIDPTATWDIETLERIGCSPELSADIALILQRPPDATQVGAILQRRDGRLPPPPARARAVDPTPTRDIPSVAIAELSPFGDGAGPG
jgi:serine/threonine protein kinase